MSECCDRRDVAPAGPACPACGQRGSAVQLQTVKAMLTETALRRVELTHYRFCGDPACAVVYFGDADEHFDRQDVRVPVWQKEPPGARLLCYCFGETESGIRTELQELERTEAIDRIRAHISAQRCACEIRNPRGACCLGDVMAAVRHFDTATRASEER